jgi:WhiB family redox-sensing transcriptional regulator
MWQDSALCKGHPDPDRFFPVISRYKVPQDLRELCNACPVQAACYGYAERNRDHGIWAGLSEDERKDLRRREQRRVLRLRESAVA